MHSNSPYINRFLQPDTVIPDLSNPQNWNRYSYVYNRPIVLNDPTGHFADIFLDMAFIAMDVGFIMKDGWTPVNTAAFVLDVVCAIVPFATGGGLLVHGGEAVLQGVTRLPAIIKAGQAVEKGLQFAAANKNSGENSYTKRGKEAHKNYRDALGDDYVYDKPLDSRKRPDAVDYKNDIVRELKPDNPSAIAKGLRQVKKYADELYQETGRVFQYFVDTYKR